MRRSFAIALMALCMGTALICGAAEPSYHLDIEYNAIDRTLNGEFKLQFSAQMSTVYFSLLANLESSPNPYLSPRQQDAVFPAGFQPARISVLSVEWMREDDFTAVPFRTLSLPPSWQTYSLEDTVLAVDLPMSESDLGSTVTLRCQFMTEVPETTSGDQAITDGILTWRFGWFPMLFPDQANLVEHEGVIGYAKKDSFPLVFPWSMMSAVITVPDGYKLITGADHVEQQLEGSLATDAAPDSDKTATTRSYEVINDSPSRSLALTIGKPYATYRLEGETPIAVHILPYHEMDARLIATLALDVLADYGQRYGPYPRASLTIVENPSSHGQAFAADGIVWLSSRFFSHRNVLLPGALNRILEFVLAHEIAHQWVGLGTGIDLDAEAWLSEGLAQYLAVRYFEDRYGDLEPNVFAPQAPGLVGELVKQQWGFFNLREHFIELPYLLATRAGFDEELIKATENVQYGNAESVRLYDKGYLVARAIAAKIGTDAFESALTRAISERRADLLDARGFQRLLEEESGQSLAEFFDYWVFGPGVADYAIRILDRSVKDGMHRTRVAVSREGGVEQPVVVEAIMQSEGTVKQEWDGVELSAELEFLTPTFVTHVTIDPGHDLPDIDRLNNHSPAKIVGAVSENMLPLDAYVLAPDQSTGGVVFSHLDRLRIMVSQTKASASVTIERNHSLSMTASFTSSEPTGKLAYTYTAYEQPETGSAAGYWEPAYAFTLTALRYVADNEPGMAVALRATHLPSITRTSFESIFLRLAPEGVGQVELSALYEGRLIPGVYLRGIARVATSTGPIPSPLRFSLSELRSIAIPPSNHIAVGKLSLELPSPTALPYSLFHLAMIDRVSSRLFVTLGAGWTTPDQFGTTSPSIEAGMEQIVELSTLGGLISLTAQIGIATPISGAGIATLYGGISF